MDRGRKKKSSDRDSPPERENSKRRSVSEEDLQSDDEMDGLNSTMVEKIPDDGGMNQESKTDIESSSEDESDMVTVLSKAERRAIKMAKFAENAAQRSLNVHGNGPRLKPMTDHPGKFNVELEALDEHGVACPDGFKSVSLLKAYAEIKVAIPAAHTQISKRNTLVVWTVNENDHVLASNIRQVCGIGCQKVGSWSKQIPLFGRIEGVHVQFTEQDIKEVLENQGVIEVRRVKYIVDSPSGKEFRNTSKVDLRFESAIRPWVEICGEKFNVTLKSRYPMQCLACLTFGHRKDFCKKKDIIRCKRCGQDGHKSDTCQKSIKCCNCGDSHFATDSRCRVYQIWAKSELKKYETQVIASMAGTGEVKIIEVIPPVNNDIVFPSLAGPSVQESAVSAPKASYASVVNRKLVMVKDGKEEDVCKLSNAVFKRQAKDQREIKKVTTIKNGSQDKGKQFLKEKNSICSSLKTLWPMVKVFLTPWLEKNPEWIKLLEFLEKSDIICQLFSALAMTKV